MNQAFRPASVQTKPRPVGQCRKFANNPDKPRFLPTPAPDVSGPLRTNPPCTPFLKFHLRTHTQDINPIHTKCQMLNLKC